MKICIPIRSDVDPDTKKDLAIYHGRLLRRGPSSTDLWEVEVKDLDELKSINFVHGKELMPKYHAGGELTYLDETYQVDSIEYHYFDVEWIVGYKLRGEGGQTIFVLESQIVD